MRKIIFLIVMILTVIHVFALAEHENVKEGANPCYSAEKSNNVISPADSGNNQGDYVTGRETVTILNESFEGAFPSGSWTVTGSPTWDDQNYLARTGSWAAWCADTSLNPSGGAYSDNMNAQMKYGPFSLSGASSFSISYWIRGYTEQNYDFLHLLISGNGNTWYTLESISGNLGTSWTNKSFNSAQIQSLTGQNFLGDSSVWIVFIFSSDASLSNYAGAFIDDILITKETTPSLPDLTIDQTSVNPTTAYTGLTFDYTYRLRNTGAASAGTSITWFCLSNDQNIGDADDIGLALSTESSINAGVNRTLTKTLTVPTNLTLGIYYVYSVTDHTGLVNESNEGNNTSPLTSITIVESEPDLAIQNGSVNPTSVNQGNSVTVTYNLLNIGTAGIGQNRTGIYLSMDSNFSGPTGEDTYLGEDVQPTAWVGSNIQVSKVVTIPANYSPGTRYLFIMADRINNFSEPNEVNNISSPIPLSITGTVATPAFNPPGGTYPTSQSVTISCATSGAQIRYTTNGNEPTESSTLYSSPITISSTTTVKAKGFKTGWTPSSTATAVYIIAVPNDDPSAIPIATVVSGNYPNPFNPTTTIEYSIKNPSHVIMGVYNSRGALVKMLVDAQKTPGFYQIAWNGEDNSGNEVSSGVYFIVLKADSVISSRKMLMMK